MQVKTFDRLDEKLYYEKLSNGLEVYLYPTTKTKNFYITISVKYGAKINEYKKENDKFAIIPGSAHFLEHKVMALSENEEISKRINDLGSLANAWTSYYGTNYNIFGSINIRENLRLLLDIFYNIDINSKNVEKEKGIIGEEIDMYKDQIDSLLYTKLFNNLFHNSYVKNTVVGERSDIEKITASHLKKIYKDYYVPNNTFIVVCGNFDENQILKDIKEYIKNIKIKSSIIPKRLKKKELPTVSAIYEEVTKDLNKTRTKCAVKINKKLFNIKNDTILKYYLAIIMSCNFSSTSSLYEKYKNENIMLKMSYNINIIDDYVVISVSSMCDNGDEFLENIKKDIRKLSVDKADFERKKKTFLKTVITEFDNIEDIEYNIATSLMIDGKIDYNIYNNVNDMDYETCKTVLKNILNNIKNDNISIIKTVK